MEKTSDETYTDLLRALGSPTIVEPDVLVVYLRDVERMHASGHITALQFDRAREAYAATIERDPSQSVNRLPDAAADLGAALPAAGALNLDPISGAHGAHPVGTGLGAALGGAAAGAVVGTVMGPVCTAIGAAVGAVIGGLAGKGVAELIDPTAEETYWRTQYSTRSYVSPEASFDDYGPAYGYGVSARREHAGVSFDEAEGPLSAGWELARGASTLEWERAKPATRDAWERVGGRP